MWDLKWRVCGLNLSLLPSALSQSLSPFSSPGIHAVIIFLMVSQLYRLFFPYYYVMSFPVTSVHRPNLGNIFPCLWTYEKSIHDGNLRVMGIAIHSFVPHIITCLCIRFISLKRFHGDIMCTLTCGVKLGSWFYEPEIQSFVNLKVL